ncbi:hypothetical protein PVIIG_05590 [Plasmodium vivax India VII]|uniref:Uncharacterized protein n=2 Tax=Plasmodium vivax TaxID=5855 RepID=A0A0J9S346_PLAVI|nr:hypothetical protein PVIIG_05590 [Plasmodium vivax India VII]
MKEKRLQASGMEGKGETLSTGSEGGREQSAEPPSSLVHPSNEETPEMGSNPPPSYDPPTPTITKSIVTSASAAGLLVPPFLIYNVIIIVNIQQDVLFYI